MKIKDEKDRLSTIIRNKGITNIEWQTIVYVKVAAAAGPC